MKNYTTVLGVIALIIISNFSGKLLSQPRLGDKTQYLSPANKSMSAVDITRIQTGLKKQYAQLFEKLYREKNVLFIDGMLYAFAPRIEFDAQSRVNQINQELQRIKDVITKNENYDDVLLKSNLIGRLNKLVVKPSHFKYYHIDKNQLLEFKPVLDKTRNIMKIERQGAGIGYIVGFDLQAFYSSNYVYLPKGLGQAPENIARYIVKNYNDAMYAGETRSDYGNSCNVCPRNNSQCPSCSVEDKKCKCDCNYCSSIGKYLDLLYDRVFSMPCGRHDCCYSYGNRTYNQDNRGIRDADDCDLIFAYELSSMCNIKFSGARQIGCIVTADLMYHAVNTKVIHEGHYINNNRQCPCEYLRNR